MSLFVDDSDDEWESNKRQKLDPSSSSDDSLSDSDLSESEWEDIALSQTQGAPETQYQFQADNANDSFSVPIGAQHTAEAKQRKARIQEYVRQKKRKVALHNLSMVSYMLHADHRNRLLNQKPVQKALKRLVPDSVASKVKKLRKSIRKSSPDADVQLVYILKYLIKWFRLNYKISSNGLRVLGYAPQNYKRHLYFPHNSPPVGNVGSFVKTIKHFSHNRDIAAQILTGILRSLGFEARLVFSVPVLSPKSKNAQPKLTKVRMDQKNDYDLLYPYFWTEVVNPMDKSELFIVEACAFHDEHKRLTRVSRYAKTLASFTDLFFPVQDKFNSMTMTYVMALDGHNRALDVSARYMKSISYRWFARLDLRTELGRSFLLYTSMLRLMNRSQNFAQQLETECLEYLGLHNYEVPNTRSAIKRNPNFTTADSLRYDEVLVPGAQPVTKVKIDGRKVPVFFRNDVIVGKSEQQWKFLGRSIIPQEKDRYIKLSRSLLPRTVARKRMYNLNIQNGTPELNAVALYSFSQTCPYIKEKVVYRHGKAVLPRNKFGNIEIYNQSMVPDGGVWLQMTDIESILSSQKKREIHYVAVVTGFSFKKKGYAIPRKNGVIVAESDAETAKDKRQRHVRGMYGWQALIQRLRLKRRLDDTYNDNYNESTPP